MLIRVGKFLKQNGEEREMKFLKNSDMTEEQKNKIGLTPDKESKKKKLAEGSEMVYDLDAKDFRIFNWATTTAEVVQQEMEYEV